MYKDVISKISEGKQINQIEAEEIMESIIEGKLSKVQITAILIAIKMKRESKEEILGFVKAIKKYTKTVKTKEYSIDTCGTGGDYKNTFNISTAVSIVTAAAGITVAKHGNHSITSKSGSADVLRELGVKLNITKEEAEDSLEKNKMTFFYAPNYNNALKEVVELRQEIGTRTIFNLLGPLLNPADIKGQVMGVYDGCYTEILAQTLKGLGRERALVVSGNDGLDEITVSGKTKVSELRDGVITNYEIDPIDYGIPYGNLEDIKGGTPKENSEILVKLLKGERGTKRNILLLNAGAAIYIGKKSKSILEGIKKAEEIIDSRLGLKKLEELILYNGGDIGCIY